MDKYIEMIRIRFLMMLAYRTNYYTGILIYSINIGAYYFLWNAIYGGKDEIQGLSVIQMTTYIAVAWMARAFTLIILTGRWRWRLRKAKLLWS